METIYSLHATILKSRLALSIYMYCSKPPNKVSEWRKITGNKFTIDVSVAINERFHLWTLQSTAATLRFSVVRLYYNDIPVDRLLIRASSVGRICWVVPTAKCVLFSDSKSIFDITSQPFASQESVMSVIIFLSTHDLWWRFVRAGHTPNVIRLMKYTIIIYTVRNTVRKT